MRYRIVVAVAAVALSVSIGCAHRDTHERLNPVLWMQTSAEYQVLAATTYRDARENVARMVDQISKGQEVPSAALEQPGSNTSGLPPAVVLDIDETVLDNSPMSGKLILSREGYNLPAWDGWVRVEKAEYISGAQSFIEWLRERDIAVFFITNRTEAEEQATISDLLPIVVTDNQLLASKETGTGETSPWESEKQARRAYVAKSHWILALVGDDLADFIPGIRKMKPADRVSAAQAYAGYYNRNWFLLPNPLYGSWESVLYDSADPDDKQLAAKRALVKGY